MADSRQGGGVSGIEIALFDIIGKFYKVPVYQLLGGKYRDKVRIYCDTDVDGKHTGRDMGKALKKRMDDGFTFLKMDLGIELLYDEPGTLNAPIGMLEEMQKYSMKAICHQSGSIDKSLIEYSQFLACAGYTYIFEEGRRQPMCSMVMNWCFNEPWYCAANNSLVGYGNIKKPTYEAVKKALEPITLSLRMKRFDYHKGDLFEGEVHILNDSGKPSGITQIEVYLDDGTERKLCSMPANNMAANEFLGKVSFEIDDELLPCVVGNYAIVSITLKAGSIEKQYPIFVWNN